MALTGFIPSPSASPLASFADEQRAGAIFGVPAPPSVPCLSNVLARVGLFCTPPMWPAPYSRVLLSPPATAVAVLSSLALSWGPEISAGGPSVAIWGWCICAFFTILTGLAMAELCSAMPSAGAPARDARSRLLTLPRITATDCAVARSLDAVLVRRPRILHRRECVPLGWHARAEEDERSRGCVLAVASLRVGSAFCYTPDLRRRRPRPTRSIHHGLVQLPRQRGRRRVIRVGSRRLHRRRAAARGPDVGPDVDGRDGRHFHPHVLRVVAHQRAAH